MSKKIKLVFKKDNDSEEKLQKQNINLKSYKCSKCKQITRLDDNQIQNMVIQCPTCGQQNIFKLPLEPSKKTYRESNPNYLFSALDKNAVIVGSLLLFMSIFPLFISTEYSLKINLTLIIMGVIIALFVLEKQQDISLKITVGIIIFIIFLFFITGTDIEVFLILIFLGASITKILLDEYLPTQLKIRMNIFLSTFFIIFLILVIKRIINVVNI